MVTGSRIDGGTQILPARVRKTIQSIKEIVGNHSDVDIYVALKETNMDPNETAQKLLNQDPFHEVRRRRDKKENMGYKSDVDPRKESHNVGQGNHSVHQNMGYKGGVDPRKQSHNVGQGVHSVLQNTGYKGAVDPRKQSHNVGQGMHSVHQNMGHKGAVAPRNQSHNVGQGMHSFYDRNAQRGGYTRHTLPRHTFPDAGISKEFRVVRDNRVGQNTNKEMKPVSPQHSMSNMEPVVTNVSDKSSTGTLSSQNPVSGHNSSQVFNGPTDSQPRHVRDINSSGGTNRKEVLEEKRITVSNAVSRVQGGKPNSSQPHPTTFASNSSVVGLYTSRDPVHVPSPDSRSLSAVGAIKREVGVVGVRRQSAENSVKSPSAPHSSVSNSTSGRDISAEPHQPVTNNVKAEQHNQSTSPESVVASVVVNRSSISNQYGSRSHQQVLGHQKASQPSKEWKPKATQKSSVIGPLTSVSPPADNLKDLESEATQDNLSQVLIQENQNVIIAQHIRVLETDRCQLTFGSFGLDFDSSKNFACGRTTEELNVESGARLSVSAQESSSDDAPSGRQVDFLDDQVRNSESDSQASGVVFEHPLLDKKESSSPQNLEYYADRGLVRGTSTSDAPSVSQHQQYPPELPSFSAYDPQTGYDIPYFRSAMDETIHGQGLPSQQEVLSSHTANHIPASTIAMVQQHQQQQPPVAQLYPQVHVSHYANLMPYRQFLSPVYMPPMAMPGYSNNPAYPHPSNASSYLLMPGGNSHLSASGVKYGIQPYKPVPAGSPTGFGNFASPTGYAINAPGVVGNGTGLEDSSRIKYKDGNLYVLNPQAETSEVWIQNPREIPGMQSTPYYNMTGQTPHAAYMPSNVSHAPFNAAAAQSSHVQYPGLYHPPPQPSALANPHHLGGNVGVGVAAAAPGAQVGAYQQQLGHLNWTTNF